MREHFATFLPASSKICLQFIEGFLGAAGIGLFVETAAQDEDVMKATLDAVRPTLIIYMAHVAITSWQTPWNYVALLRWGEAYELMLSAYQDVLDHQVWKVKKCDEPF